MLPGQDGLQVCRALRAFSDVPVLMPQLTAGKVKALFITGSKPLEQLKGVPTFDSLYPGVGISSWHGIFAPIGVPRALLLDTGHFTYAGEDPLAVLGRHAARVNHVHCKDVRVDVLAKARAARGGGFDEIDHERHGCCLAGALGSGGCPSLVRRAVRRR